MNGTKDRRGQRVCVANLLFEYFSKFLIRFTSKDLTSIYIFIFPSLNLFRNFISSMDNS